MLTLQLPFPPTTNNLFANARGGRGGRFPTKAYKAWRDRAAVAIRRQAPAGIKGPVTLDIQLGRPDRRRRDLSNYIKALEDALVQHGLIEDDSMVQTLLVEWGSTPGATLRVSRWTGERMGEAA
jgi:crossover junction endodeoxyribonuclease RusA